MDNYKELNQSVLPPVSSLISQSRDNYHNPDTMKGNFDMYVCVSLSGTKEQYGPSL